MTGLIRSIVIIAIGAFVLSLAVFMTDPII